MNIKRTILIIGAGVEQIDGIKRAQELGLFVVSVDGNPQAPGFSYADDYGVVSTYDIAGNVHFAKEYSKNKRPIDAVITLASDIPMTVSAVAEALRIPGNSMKAAILASDKYLMKQKFTKDKVSIPSFKKVKNKREIETFIKKHGYPIILKPVDSRGARGVLRITKDIDLKWAIETSMAESPTKRIMVEKFISGPQFSTESVIYDGKIITTGLSDRNYEYIERFAPYIIENGGDLPARLTIKQRKELDKLLMKAAKSIGIIRGSMKGDVVYNKNKPMIIEVAARISGGYFATREVPLSTGVDLLEAVIMIALGEKPDLKKLKPKFTKAVTQRFFFPGNVGTVKSITGVEKAKKIKWVNSLHVYVKKGDVIKKIVSHPSRGGVVITCAPTRKEAKKAAEKAINAVTFHVKN